MFLLKLCCRQNRFVGAHRHAIHASKHKMTMIDAVGRGLPNASRNLLFLSSTFSASSTTVSTIRSLTIRSINSRFMSSQANSQRDSTLNPHNGFAAAGAAAVALLFFGSSYQNYGVQRHHVGMMSSLEHAVDRVVAVEDDNNNNKIHDAKEDETTDVINWSGTHKVTVSNANFWEPESVSEVEKIIRLCHQQGKTVRPLGSSLSPNGIALNEKGMISMANVDQVLDIDTKNRTITVEAGITVSKVVEALRPHGLTLPNLASIAEQQMGGFVSVGAHGTGRLIASVDDYVTKLKIVTPAKGTITLTKEDHGRLFELARVGLGLLGVVVEVTMECIPAHKLVEHTFVLTREEAISRKDQLLKDHKHMRFMWIPYTDAVVVVTNDPENDVSDDVPRNQTAPGTAEEKSKPLVDLLRDLSNEYRTTFSAEDVKGMGFGELRDSLLAFDPLNVDHVRRCNQAEADFWKVNEGYRTLPSDQLLQFDCGGQQWVFEVCFETGTQEENNNNDMIFMKKLLEQIETNKIPAHSPIEQRWSASSSSPMSPSHGDRDGLHTWVGIINYLPSEDPKQREEITKLFTGEYCDLVRSIGRPYKAVSHWAKLEQPKSEWKAVELKSLYMKRFPLDEFNIARGKYDPKNILSTPLLDLVLGKPKDER